METLNFFFTALGQMAFPVVCSVFCFWYLVQKDKENKLTISEMEHSHREEISGLQKAIEANTAVLNRLMERLDR